MAEQHYIDGLNYLKVKSVKKLLKVWTNPRHNYICKGITRNKVNTVSSKFRNTQAWRNKRKSAHIRDKGLCQLCIRNLYNTYTRAYDNKLIEVHHIEPIVESYELRLDDSNLISLCTYHHKMADRGEVPRAVLKNMIKG